MPGPRWSSRAVAMALLCLGSSLAPTMVMADGEFDATAVFTTRCAACHTVGKGDLIGPDLAGVTERRERLWLIAFIRSSQSVILSGDPTANELFERFGGTKMPDHPYAEEEIESLLALIEGGGPAPRITFRPAVEATAEEIAAGRDLFFGRSTLTVGCASCHTLRRGAVDEHLYLGGSLGRVFSRYQDRELEAKLTRPGVLCGQPLSPEESFRMRAFLRDVEAVEGERNAPVPAFPLLAGGVGLLLIFLGRGGRRDGGESGA